MIYYYMIKLIKRLITTTTQEDFKAFDQVVTKIVKNKIDINDKNLNKIFKQKLECCEKCQEVKKIVKPKVTFKMEQD